MMLSQPNRPVPRPRFLARLSLWRVAGLVAVFALSARGAGEQVLPRHLPAAVRSLTPVGRLAATNRLNLAISLPLRDAEGLANLLAQIYDPASTNYHHYLTAAEFAEKFGPTEADYQTLADFARASGFTVTRTHPNRTLLDVNASVADIERTLHLTMRVYQHPREARTFHAPDTEPTLDLALPVLDIAGLDDFEPPRPMSLKAVPNSQAATVTPNAGTGSGFNGEYLPVDLRNAYLPGVALNGAGQSVGLLEFDGYYAGDIAAYVSQTGSPSVPLTNVLLDSYSGAAGANNVEVALDIEMAIAFAPGLAKIMVYEGTMPNDILNQMATDDQAKQTQFLVDLVRLLQLSFDAPDFSAVRRAGTVLLQRLG